MSQFRKKPIVVDAEQWFPNKEVKGVHKGDNGPYVITIQGHIAYLSPGDWVIEEYNGINHYPCRDDVFQATYDPI